MKNKKISVIVPVYNCSEFLDECISSVLNQTYKNIELILINDGSIDNSGDICKKYSNKDNRVIYINQKNSGVSISRNNGIDKASGEYIFFLDSDDYIDNTVLEDLLKYSNNSNLCSVLYKKVLKNKIVCKEKKSYDISVDYYLKEMILGKRLGVVWGYLFKTEFIKNIKFNTKINYMEDTLLLVEYLDKANIKNIKYINDSFYYFRANENSITRSKGNILKKSNDIKFSLDSINKITNGKYSNDISNKMVRIMESQLSAVDDKNELLENINNIELSNYTEDRLRFKIFFNFYKNKNIILLRCYYVVRKFVKNIKLAIKG